jgi:hypothetical protein
VKELCEGLKLQQLGNSSKDIIRVLIFFMQVSKCVCQSQGPSKGSLRHQGSGCNLYFPLI